MTSSRICATQSARRSESSVLTRRRIDARARHRRQHGALHDCERRGAGAAPFAIRSARARDGRLPPPERARHRPLDPELFDLRASGLFETSPARGRSTPNLTETDEPERVETALVDANYFTMLGVSAERGRCSDRRMRSRESRRSPSSATRSGNAASAASERDRQRIGIDNDMYSIIGVAPASFRHPGRVNETDVDVWAPVAGLRPPFATANPPPVTCCQGGIGR